MDKRPMLLITVAALIGAYLPAAAWLYSISNI